jgi:hypothetical protein
LHWSPNSLHGTMTTHLGILVVVPQLQRVLDLLQGPERVRAQQAVLVQAAKLDGCLKNTI